MILFANYFWLMIQLVHIIEVLTKQLTAKLPLSLALWFWSISRDLEMDLSFFQSHSLSTRCLRLSGRFHSFWSESQLYAQGQSPNLSRSNFYLFLFVPKFLLFKVSNDKSRNARCKTFDDLKQKSSGSNQTVDTYALYGKGPSTNEVMQFRGQPLRKSSTIEILVSQIISVDKKLFTFDKMNQLSKKHWDLWDLVF